jgi:hypothetical protein
MAAAKHDSTDEARAGPNYIGFAIKTAIVVAIVSVALVFVINGIVDAVDMPQIKESLRKPLQDERTRLRLRGLLTTNPAVHYKMAALYEERGDMRQAIEEIELGIGLLELHNGDRSARDRFAQRLSALKVKAAKEAKEPKK